VLQVLVDADNVPSARLQVLALALSSYDGDVRIVVSGHRDVTGGISWPTEPEDLALAAAYSPAPGPLVLASGDSDFVQLATRHPGPVLVVSEAAASRYRDIATVVDPVHDQTLLEQWIAAVAVDSE
jgi:hypothetical protein